MINTVIKTVQLFCKGGMYFDMYLKVKIISWNFMTQNAESIWSKMLHSSWKNSLFIICILPEFCTKIFTMHLIKMENKHKIIQIKSCFFVTGLRKLMLVWIFLWYINSDGVENWYMFMNHQVNLYLVWLNEKYV